MACWVCRHGSAIDDGMSVSVLRLGAFQSCRNSAVALVVDRGAVPPKISKSVLLRRPSLHS